MVQEVESLNAELKLSAFTHLEVLEQRQVAIPKPGSKQFWQNERTVRTRRRRQGEAVPIDELVVMQIASRIARHNRHQRDLVGSVDGLSINGRVCESVIRIHARNVSSDVEVTLLAVGLSGQVDATLDGRDARELPSVNCATQCLVSTHRA